MKSYGINRIWVAMILCLGAITGFAQGWTSGSSFSGGDPGEPYASDGNYVASMTPFLNMSYSVINYPNGVSGFRFEEYDVQLGQRRGCTIGQSNVVHHLARGIVQYAPQKLAVIEEELPVQGGNRTLALSAYEFLSPPQTCIETQWIKPAYAVAGIDAYAKALVLQDDGSFLVLAMLEGPSLPNGHSIALINLASNGNVVWTQSYPTVGIEKAKALVLSPDGDIWLLKSVSPVGAPQQSASWLMRLAPNGNVLSTFNLSANNNDIAHDLTLCADGNFALTGTLSSSPNSIFLQKVTANGNTLWRQEFTLPDQAFSPNKIIENSAGSLVLGGTLHNLLNDERDGFLMKFDANGQAEWERKVGRPGREEIITQLHASPDGGYLLGGKAALDVTYMAYAVKTDANGIVKPGRIFGNVFHDGDMNCTASSGDLPLEGWTVEAYQDSTHVFYSTTDALGNYEIECDTGNYTLKLTAPSLYWVPCWNNIPLHLGYLDTATVDFPVQTDILCPYMNVEHSAFRFRPCDSTYIKLEYDNGGTTIAEDAYIEFTLDPLLTFVSSTPAPASVTGALIRYELGDVEALQGGEIIIRVSVACNATLGQVICTQAHIYPDTTCLPQSPQWSGAFVRAKAISDGEKARFTLRNTGTQAMGMALNYIIIEDAVLLRSGSFQLQSGEEMSIEEPCMGKTLRLLAEQEPGAPGQSIPTAAIEACMGSGGTPNFGFYNQFPLDDADAFVSEFCLEVVNSWDPNDKQAFPRGYGEEHNIFANTDLEYLIRFQNKGTDTAFRVILLDTLSSHLDPASIRAGASSHPYHMELDGNRVLRFTFSNIKLPHEAADEPGSNGFVSFRIAQRPNNPVGTRIENRAGIYFDFNLPVITNTVFHTVFAPSWVSLVAVDQPEFASKITITAYPNPVQDQAQIGIGGEAIAEGRLRLYYSDGRLAAEQPFSGNEILLQRKNLLSGLYMFTIEAEGNLLGSGRIVVE